MLGVIRNASGKMNKKIVEKASIVFSPANLRACFVIKPLETDNEMKFFFFFVFFRVILSMHYKIITQNFKPVSR
jgi:hypothetical protein